jgi:hypothetical protein
MREKESDMYQVKGWTFSFSLLATLLATLVLVGTAVAHLPGERKVSSGQQSSEVRRDTIPELVTSEHWAYRDMVDLLQKYDKAKSLPEGRSCTRAELAGYLDDVLGKVLDAHELQGNRSLPKGALEKLVALRHALEQELSRLPHYQEKGAVIEKFLAPTEVLAPL